MDAFPLHAGEFLPHNPPMLCIDALLSVSASGAEASALLGPDHILLHDGLLCEPGFVELAAQTAGAMQGYLEKALGLPVKKGFLAAAQGFSFLAPAKQGDTLHIAVSLVGEVAGVSLLETAIRRKSDKQPPELLAQGKLKVFIPE